MLRSLALEYARAYARFSPDARRLLVAAALSAFARQSFAVLRNLYLKELGFPEDTIGTIVGAASIGQALIALPAVVVMARLGYRGGLAGALCLDLLASAVQAASTTYAPLALASGCSGAAASLFTCAAQPCLMKVSRPEERPFLFSMSFATMTVSGGVGSSVGGGLAELFSRLAGGAIPGFRLALGASVVAIALALPWVLSLSREVLGAPPAAERVGLRGALRLKEPMRVLAISVPELIIGLGAGLTIPFLQIYFRNTFLLGSFAIGNIYMAGWAGMGAAYLLAPAFARRFGARRTIVLSQAASVVFLVELAFPSGLPLAICSFVMRTTLMNLAAPVLSQYTLELVCEEDRRGLSSVVSLVRGLAWAAAAAAGGWLIAHEHGDFSHAIATTAALYLLAALVGGRLYHRLERSGAERPS